MNSSDPVPRAIDRGASGHRGLLRTLILWSFLVISLGFAVMSSVGLMGSEFRVAELQFGWSDLIGLVSLAALNLLFAAAQWRKLVQSIGLADPGLRLSVIAVGQLLLGKYVPSGLVGVAWRLFDAVPGDVRARVLLATLVEQGLAMLVLLLVGTWALAIAAPHWAWALSAILVSVLATSFLWKPGPCIAFALRFVPGPIRRRMSLDHPDVIASNHWFRVSAAWTLAHQLCWLPVVWIVLGVTGHSADLADVLLVYGAFAIAVFAGFLVILAPSGIGVREGVVAVLLVGRFDLQDALLLAVVLRLAAVGVDAMAGLALVVLRPGRMVAGLPRDGPSEQSH